MNRRLLVSVVCTVAVLGVALSTSAFAQEAPQVTQEAPQATPEASEAVQETVESGPETSESAEDTFDEIIVTARRVEEKLQDVPISITVFNQEQLTNLNVVSYKDLAAYTPSLSVNTRYGSDQTSFTIRGFTQEGRTTPSVGVYFADVVAPRGGGTYPGGDGAGPGSFFDLQNVQTLKGPQGTLFGRNTTGGAVLLVPQKPTHEYEGYIEGTVGNYDLRRTQGVINLPLTESFRLRAGIDWQQRDGYLDNISGFGPKDFNDVDYVAGRVSAVWDIAPNLETYFIGSYTESDNNGAVAGLKACNPAASFGSFNCAQIAREAGRDFWTVQNSLGSGNQPGPRNYIEQWQAINTTTWTATDTLTVKNIVSYAQLKSALRQDVFGTNWKVGSFDMTFVPVLAAPETGLTNHQSTFTEELQFQGSTNDERLVWQVGGYFELSKPLGDFGVQNPVLMPCTDPYAFECFDLLGASDPRGGRQGTTGALERKIQQTEFRDMAVYAQASYKLTEKLKLTAGLRYTDDYVEGWAIKNTIRFPTANNPVVYCNDPSMGYPVLPNVGSTPGVRNDFSNGLPLDQRDVCYREDEKRTSAPTWLLGLDYKPTQDLLVYGKYARGYRQGSIGSLAADGFNSFDAEQVDSFEIGSKLSWDAVVPGTFNLALFYNDFTDQQLSVGTRSSTNSVAPAPTIFNAGKSRIQGLEAETSLRLFKGFHFNVSYAYLDSLLKEFEQPVLTPGSAYDTVDPVIVGGALPFAIKDKLVAGINYELPLQKSIGQISMGLAYAYQSDFLTGYTGRAIIPSYSLVNANLNWNAIMGSSVDAAFFVTNLTNKEYYTHVNDQYDSSIGFLSYYMGEPRMFGLRLKMHFGG